MSGLLVHEWIESAGGAEKVLGAMGQAFPGSDILSLWNDAPTRFSSHKVFETWLSKTPLRRYKALALPFMIPTWRNIRLKQDYDWILSSSHLFAHSVSLRGSSARKYVYAHTPARYIWTPELDQRGNNLAVKSIAPIFKRIDKSLVAESAGIAGNSNFVRERIRNCWDMDAEVIYPPVEVKSILDVDSWQEKVVSDKEKEIVDNLPEHFLLGISRFIPYKRLDAVLETARILGVPVVIAGNGPQHDYLLRVVADLNIPAQVIHSPSDELVYTLMQRASVFLFPPVEDFGIVPVEAQATGTPVVTGPIGGQTETFIPGVSGVMADSSEPVDLARAAEQAMSLPKFDPESVTAKFSADNFKENIQRFVSN